jgi:hypothetical protein
VTGLRAAINPVGAFATRNFLNESLYARPLFGDAVNVQGFGPAGKFSQGVLQWRKLTVEN